MYALTRRPSECSPSNSKPPGRCWRSSLGPRGEPCESRLRPPSSYLARAARIRPPPTASIDPPLGPVGVSSAVASPRPVDETREDALTREILALERDVPGLGGVFWDDSGRLTIKRVGGQVSPS